MKNISVLMLLLLALFSGCSDNDEKVTPVEEKIFSFDIRNEKPFQVPMAQANAIYDVQGIYPLVYPITGISSTTEADLQKNNTTTSLVKNIVLKELLLVMPDNAVEDFSFLEKMDVYIAMGDESEQLLVAYNRNVPNTPEKKVAFNIEPNVSLDKYLKAGSYSMILKDTRLRRKVTADLNMTMRVTYSVTANPLK